MVAAYGQRGDCELELVYFFLLGVSCVKQKVVGKFLENNAKVVMQYLL